MSTDGFEWDAAKAHDNEAKHGVNFATAVAVFKDPFAVERLDDRMDYGEDRFILIGSAANMVLTVVYAERNGRIRLISARAATKRERDDYFIQNQ